MKGLSPVDSLSNAHLNTKHNQYFHALGKAVLPQACAAPKSYALPLMPQDAAIGSLAISLRWLSLPEIGCQVSLLQHPFLINNFQDDQRVAVAQISDKVFVCSKGAGSGNRMTQKLFEVIALMWARKLRKFSELL